MNAATSRRTNVWWNVAPVIAALVAAVTGLSLGAQAPAPAPAGPGSASPQSSTPQTNTPPQTGVPPQAGDRGGGQGGRGRGAQADLVPDFTKQPAILPKTPEEQLKTFILSPGYRLELVLADPIIKEPTAIAFDGNGRMFVLEDRSYMLDLDMTGQLDPISRISMHVDANNDGVYDRHTVFIDNLVFPRFIQPLEAGAILTKESNADELWKYTDTNGDGVADRKELVDTGYGRLANIEGQEAFLTWAMDNWMYSTYNAFRARWTPSGIVKEPTGNNSGEWGVVQDDDGKVWFESGAPGVPVAFQFPIVYAAGLPSSAYNPPDQYEPDFRIPWGAPVRVADMQGGLNATRMPDGSLRSVTSSAGNDIVRGHRLPPDLAGDYLYGEPVGRIVRRIRIDKREGFTTLRNAYPNNEFVKSLDPLFRPVDITTAPDGTVYITDMYRGIIQVGNFTRPGSYLRSRIEQYSLDKVVHHGRIWRLVYDGVALNRSDRLRRDTTMPRMHDETPAQLVRHLSHPNGWWRDTAQRLLVLKQNRSVAPALENLVRSSPTLVARFHALWTLEGLGAMSPALVRQQFADKEPRMRVQAIRASETLYKAGDRTFAKDYDALTKDPVPDVAMQAMLTMHRWKVPGALAAIKSAAETNQARGVQMVATAVLTAAANPGRGGGGGRGGMPPDHVALVDKGQEIYAGLCVACHGDDGLGTPKPELATTMAPAIAGSPRVTGHRDYVVKVLLHGLAGPVDDKTYTDVMFPQDMNSDEWIASVASYVRNSFGNRGPVVTPADVARVRAETAARTGPWTVAEITASLPSPIFLDGWKATASHNSDSAGDGLTLTTWSSGAVQQAGMWYQIELSRPARVTELQFQSPAAAARGAAVANGGSPMNNAGGPAYPRAFTVEVAMDGAAWTPVAEHRGVGLTTIVAFPPVEARFVRMTLAAGVEGETFWSIQALKAYRAP